MASGKTKVCTALTIQNEKDFEKPNWVSWENIKSQLGILSAERVKFSDINAVINDVKPFLRNIDITKIWNENYFLELVKRFEVVSKVNND